MESPAAEERKAVQLKSRPVALIIGPDTAQTALIRKALVEARFEVHKADRGETALAVLDLLAPALVLLDWNLPDMSALAITRDPEQTRLCPTAGDADRGGNQHREHNSGAGSRCGLLL
jgi:PleD family two-component response regulator